jgi:hypothetical protein
MIIFFKKFRLGNVIIFRMVFIPFKKSLCIYKLESIY